ncbi:MAG: hypothetical protein IJC59_05800 [Lachnospiraceae bacterium]|nr:hypothetical protein [Lachnospiraceae bacterium]
MRKNKGKYIVGYDLSRRYAQISYLEMGSGKAETLSMVAGEQQYNIPLVLYKNEEDNKWWIGREAIRRHAGLGGLLVEELLELACRGEWVESYPEPYDPCVLLAIFIRRSLSLLSIIAEYDNIWGIMFTLEELGQTEVEVMRRVIEYLQLPQCVIRFVRKEESLYHYTVHSERQLWQEEVLVYEFTEKGLVRVALRQNKRTTPRVFLTEKEVFPGFEEAAPDTEEAGRARDRRFTEVLEKEFDGRKVSSVYLIGDGFEGDWYQSSIRFLCTRGRVFRGNNLYSKGACYCMLDLETKQGSVGEQVYLGEDKLLANVGMEILRQGKPAYLAVLDGGSSWYEAGKEWEVILENSSSLTFTITPLNGDNRKEAVLELDGLRGEDQPFVRVRIEAFMVTARKMRIRVTDRGFGEFYPATKRCWEEDFTL